MAVWIVLGVVGVHLLFFWAVSNRHFLPKTRYVPPAPTPNFGSRQTVTVDPQTGERTVKSEFVVSTKLVTPVPQATAK